MKYSVSILCRFVSISSQYCFIELQRCSGSLSVAIFCEYHLCRPILYSVSFISSFNFIWCVLYDIFVFSLHCFGIGILRLLLLPILYLKQNWNLLIYIPDTTICGKTFIFGIVWYKRFNEILFQKIVIYSIKLNTKKLKYRISKSL